MSIEKNRENQAGVPQGVALVLGSTPTVIAVLALAPVLPNLMVVFHDVPNATFWVPALISVSGLGAALSSPFVGFIGDRFGRRIPLIAFCVLFAIAGLLPLVLDDFTSIFVTRIVVGIAYMGVLVLSIAMVGDYFSGASRDRWLAIQAMVATFAALALLPLSGFLGAWLSWRGPFLIYFLGLPLAIAYWALFRNSVSSEVAGSHVGWSALPWPWLLGICFISLFSAVFFYAVQMQLGLALAAVGITETARIGLLSAVAIAGVPAGALLFMRVAAHPFGRLMRLQLLVNGATLMTMRYVDDYRIFIVVAFINLMSSGMMIPTLLTNVTRHLDVAVRARGIGVWQSAFSMGQFVSVGVSGLVMQRPGATVLDAFWFLGVSGVAVVVAAWLAVLARTNFGSAASRVGR